MKKVLALTFIASLLIGSTADARNPVRVCAEAIEAGDNELIAKSAQQIEAQPTLSPADRVPAERCLTAARGEPMKYRSFEKRFMSESEYVALSNLRRAQVAQRQAEEEAAAARLAQAAMDADARRALVLAKTFDGCTALYEEDWIAAITSPVCQPIFMETGLPD